MKRLQTTTSKYGYLKLSLFLIVNFLVLCNIQAQVKQINIGHSIPNVTIKEIINYKRPNAQLSDFKGKLLILDFWATYCSPCVGMFPKEDSLEKQFKGEMHFLPVTQENSKKVKTFFEHFYQVRHIRPISIVSDSLFNKLFSYSGLPYYVWIDSNNRVIATTGKEEVTYDNIHNILIGKPPAFTNRTDLRFRKYDVAHSPAFVLSNNFVLKDSLTKREEIPSKEIFSYSIATRAVEHARGGIMFDTSRFAAVNITIDWIFRWYYDVFYYSNPVQGAFDSKLNHVFEISDTTLLNKIAYNDHLNLTAGSVEMYNWLLNNTVCYEIRYPKGLTWKEKGELVKSDLERYFSKPMGFETHVEHKIDSNTIVLTCNSNIKIVFTKGDKAEENHDRYAYTQHNLPISHLIGVLNSYFFQGKNISFIDKTNLTVPIDLDLTCDMTKIESINSALSKYGLRLEKKPTVIDVLVFSSTKI